MEDLKVTVPKRFKKELSYRFNPQNAVKNGRGGSYSIEYDCPLCKAFYHCDGCPFVEFEDEINRGCICWLEKVIGKSISFVITLGCIAWREYADKESRKQLKTLRKKAKELIIWEGGE